MTGARLLRWLIGGIAIALLAVFGLAPHSDEGRMAGPLPRQSLTGGPPTTLADLRGKPVLLIFWASWCDPCQREAPELERAARTLAGRAAVIGVDWNDASSAARSFIRRYDWTFPNVRDGEGLVGDAYGLSGLPTTFVIDSRGRIRQTLRGGQTLAKLDTALANL